MRRIRQPKGQDTGTDDTIKHGIGIKDRSQPPRQQCLDTADTIVQSGTKGSLLTRQAVFGAGRPVGCHVQDHADKQRGRALHQRQVHGQRVLEAVGL